MVYELWRIISLLLDCYFHLHALSVFLYYIKVSRSCIVDLQADCLLSFQNPVNIYASKRLLFCSENLQLKRQMLSCKTEQQKLDNGIFEWKDI